MCQMCRCLNFAHPKRAKCVQCACKCCNQSLFPKRYENVCKSVNMQNFAHPHACKMCAVCLQICNWNLFAIKCGYAKFCTFTHVRNVHIQNVFDVHACFAIMCAKVWMCEILHIHTRAICVPFLSLLCLQLPKYGRANLLIYLHTKLPRLL